MRVVPPPDQPYRHGWRVGQATEGDALSPVLREGALGGDSDAPSGGDDGEPVVDVVDLLDLGLVAEWPEVKGGGAGAWIDGEYGLSGAYLGVEAKLGREGIVAIVETPLTEDEKALLVEAYEAVKAKQGDVKDL